MKKIFITASLVIGCLCANAQDIHFSQFYASPLTLNPALTGKFNGDWRLTGIYRNQWAGSANYANKLGMFQTPSASVDVKLFSQKLEKDVLGAGFVFVNDQTNDGIYNTFKGGLSLAYALGLGKNNGTQISLGAQGVYVQRQLDFNKIIAIDPSLLNDPKLVNTSKYFDLNAGLFLNTRLSKSVTFYAGGSVFNLLQPKQQFNQNITPTTTDNGKLAMRYVGHGGFEIKTGKRLLLIPGGLYQTTAKAREINTGLTAGIKMSEKPESNAMLFLGGWYRWDDAMIAKAGFEYKKLRVGLSYDAHVVRLSNDTKKANYNFPGSFELSASYIGNFFTPKDDLYLFNPRY